MSEKQTLLDTDFVTLWYYPESKILHHVFHQPIHGEPFREVLETGLRVFQENRAVKWLSDDRKNADLPTDDMAWSINDWNPRVLDAGWKYWALVLPDKLVGKVHMQTYIDLYAKRGLKIEIFEDPDVALAWLESV